MRRLIINADDFGMTAGVNRAIAEAHTAGLVTSATLMANETAVGEAIATAKQFPKLSAGCHVVLVDGTPVSSAGTVASLLANSNGSGAKFRTGISDLALAAALQKLKADEIRRESAAQIQSLKDRGLAPSHVDCHMHSHILPVVADAVLSVARDHGISAARNPFEPAWSVRVTHKATSLRSWNRSLQVTVLRSLQARFLDTAKKHLIRVPDGTLGIAVTGLLNRTLLSRLLAAMPEGTWELVTHPGYNDDDLAQASTELKQSRATELELLTSEETLRAIEKHGIQLISYREL